jgi:hypothetical protein
MIDVCCLTKQAPHLLASVSMLEAEECLPTENRQGLIGDVSSCVQPVVKEGEGSKAQRKGSLSLFLQGHLERPPSGSATTPSPPLPKPFAWGQTSHALPDAAASSPAGTGISAQGSHVSPLGTHAATGSFQPHQSLLEALAPRATAQGVSLKGRSCWLVAQSVCRYSSWRTLCHL